MCAHYSCPRAPISHQTIAHGLHGDPIAERAVRAELFSIGPLLREHASEASGGWRGLPLPPVDPSVFNELGLGEGWFETQATELRTFLEIYSGEDGLRRVADYVIDAVLSLGTSGVVAVATHIWKWRGCKAQVGM